MHGTNCMYVDMLCSCANAPIKGQRMLLRALSLSLALLLADSLLVSALAGASTLVQRLSRPDIAGHRRIRGGGN